LLALVASMQGVGVRQVLARLMLVMMQQAQVMVVWVLVV